MRALSRLLAVAAVFLVLAGLFVPLGLVPFGGSEKAFADGGAISGTVTRALTGEPLEGITVELYYEDFFFNSTTTNSSGIYEFNWLGTGSFYIHFPASGPYYDEWYNNAPDQLSADLVDVTDGLTTSGIDAQLKEDGSIGGTVYRAYGSTPLEGIEVDLFASDGTTLLGNTYSDADGTYSFSWLESGSYYVYFFPYTIYYEEWYDDAADFAAAAPVVVAPSQTSQADAYLEEAGSVSGTVYRASDNTALEGIEVELYDSGGSSLLDFTTSGAGGAYSFSAIDPGSYLVFFNPAATYLTEWYDGAPDLPSADPVAVAASQVTPGIDAYLDSIGPPWTLTTHATGSGSVTPDPDGSPYADDTVVQLTATPDTGWHFVEWTGDLTGSTNPASITMDANKSVTAVFAIDTHTLTVNTTGSGSVSKNPDLAPYDYGTVVELTAVPEVGWHFVGWTGDLTGSVSPASITMDAAKTVTAVFAINTYTLTTDTTGNGSVERNLSQTTYDHGTVVQLNAIPDAGWYFVEWTGDLTGSVNPANITMDGNKTVTAVFSDITTLTTDTTGSGSVTLQPPGGSYSGGTSVQLTAVPDAGWHFVEWTGDLTGSANPASITMDANKMVTAVFADTWALAVSTTGSGSVTLDPAGGSYADGISVQLTAEPAIGWHFVEWTGDVTGSVSPANITMNSDKSVTAVFAINTYSLSTGQDGHGTVAKNPSQTTYDHGTVVRLTATPDPGWHFVEWTGDVTGDTSPVDITMDANKTAIAHFAINTYTLATNTTGSGSVVKNPDLVDYDHGAVVQLTAVPSAGWHFVEWTGDLTGSANPASITMDANKMVTAVFADTWALAVSTTGSGSVTLDPAGGSYADGTSVELTAVPAAGWHLVEWAGDLAGGVNPANITMYADKSVTAVFAIDVYSLTVNTTGSGSFTRNPDQAGYDYGTVVQLTATPATGWHFVEWTGDLTGSTNPANITMDGNETVTAVFAVNTYTLATDTTGSGSVVKNPDQATYDHGAVVQLTAAPSAGWHFVEWTGDLTGSVNPANITMDGNKTVTAVFSNIWTLAVSTTGSGSVTLNPAGGSYTDGTSVQLTAVPAAGWHFVEWTGGLTGGANPANIAMDASKTVTAVFAVNTYTLTVNATGSGSVAIDPGQAAYDHGTVVQLTAVPAAGWHFVEWTGGLTGGANPASITMNADKTVTAVFAINTYTVTASVSGSGGTVSPATQLVEHGAPATVTITPEAGFEIASILDNGISQTVARPYVIDSVTSDHAVAVTFASGISPSAVWYLAEGSTNWGFETYISIENPNAEAVNVALTYMTSTGAAAGPSVTMPAMSQATVYPSSTLGAADFSTKVECLEGKTISVDRTMTWLGTGATCPEAHCATGVTAAAGTWYMPEGSANWGFECFLLIQNPNDAEAPCTVTWMIEGASPSTTDVTVLPNSRLTIDMAYCIGARDASIKVDSDMPIICERAMYRNHRREGHASTGTTTAAADYYLAEGSTGWGFTTFVLVQNPNDTENEVTLTYQAPSGTVPGPTVYMTPNSRITVNVNATTAIPGSDPSFSTHIHGSAPIIAERAMYWKGGPDNGEVCHGSIGLSEPHVVWYLADGQTSEGRETWTLVQNPNDADVTVELTYMTPDGTGNVVIPEIVPAGSRKSFNTLAWTGINGRCAVMVRCTTPGMKIMCERAMYWNNRGSGTDTIGGYSD